MNRYSFLGVQGMEQRSSDNMIIACSEVGCFTFQPHSRLVMALDRSHACLPFKAIGAIPVEGCVRQYYSSSLGTGCKKGSPIPGCLLRDEVPGGVGQTDNLASFGVNTSINMASYAPRGLRQMVFGVCQYLGGDS